MKDNGHEDKDDFEELRRLLLGDELQKLEQLHTHVEIPENFSSQVGEILPQALRKSSEQGEALSEAMVPTVEEIVRLSIKKDINRFADALFPVIGPAIRKAIRETLRQMLQSLNRTLEQGLSWQGLKWRLESIRTGIPFAQIAMLHGLVYRVEQVFLIHRETGLLLCHREQADIQKKNPDLVTAMLAAINDFVGDSFAVEAERSLGSIEVGELSIWIEPGPDAILAVAIRGEAPNSLRIAMQQTLEEVQRDHGEMLAQFSGDTEHFESRGELLDSCLQAQYQVSKAGISGKSLLLLLLAAGLIGYWLWAQWHQSSLQRDYVELLRGEPGYIVTHFSEDDGRLVIGGLRDPLARLPQDIELSPELAAIDTRLQFDAYQSLAPIFVEQRARQILRPPDEVTLSLRDGMLVVAGVTDIAWRERLRALLPLIAGIDGLDDGGLQIRFTTALLDAPPGVSIQLDAGVLYVEGAAEQDWIASLAEVAGTYAEVEAVDTRALVNLTEAALVKDIAALEKEVVLFDVATSFDFDSIDTPRITKLVKSIIESAKKLSRNVIIIVRGYSDSIGSFEDNEFLSRERADYVAQAIFNSGISPKYIAIKGLEAPVKAETSEAERRYNRRVGFEVIVD